MIRNVVLDMGKVLLDFDAERYLKRYVERAEDRVLVQHELFDSVEWVMTDHGTITDEQVVQAVCARLPERLHRNVEDIMAHWYEDMPAYPGIGDVLARLKDAGYRLYILSNVSGHYDVMRRNVPHIERFDGEFISSQWRLLKPETAIFTAFCQHFGLVPAECLFIDDLKINVYGATRIGMQGLVYHGEPADIERRLAELNKK